jgi:hypothetical protein
MPFLWRAEQRQARAVENGAGGHGARVTTAPALLEPARRDPRAALLPTAGAAETVGPARLAQRLPAGLLVRKGRLKVLKRLGKLHRSVLLAANNGSRLCQLRSRAEAAA